MLGGSQRMSRAIFQAVYTTGEVRHAPHLLVRTAPSNSGKSRGSAVVSKKVLRGAVARHFLRRRLYSILRGVFAKLAQPTDVIVITKRDIDKLTFTELTTELETLLLSNK